MSPRKSTGGSSGNFGGAQRKQARAASSRNAARKQRHAAATKAKTTPERSDDTRFANRNDLRLKPAATERSAPRIQHGVRLQKVLADAGVAARRDCEQLIADGRIQVNGTTVTTLPYFIDPRKDVVAHDGVPVDISARISNAEAPPREAFTYVLINKPKGMITTARDPEGRPTVLQMVPHAIAARERLFPVGRLDADSTGLLLLTNDGDLAYQLTHPKFGVMKEYRVTTTGMTSDEQIAQLKQGLYLFTPDHSGQTRGKRARLDGVRVLKRFVDRSRGDRTVLAIQLREGQNREIRRLLARIGLKVRDLERIAIGPLRTGDLKPGQCKLLGKRDVDKLRAAVLSSAAEQR